jgi:hypothetical protein
MRLCPVRDAWLHATKTTGGGAESKGGEMTRHPKLIIIIVVILFAALILACNSTACQSNQNLILWIQGVATAQPCPVLP